MPKRSTKRVMICGGSVTTEGLRKTYPSPAMQRLANRLSGSTRYSGVVTAHDHQYQVVVESTLAGAGLDSAKSSRFTIGGARMHAQHESVGAERGDAAGTAD